ncbi:MAG TPA: c-type cytochrome, partial [Tepidisphaeraceae bacterium]|nr:c-type cytochrome [Tepidisphaeraceae bacterium]
LASPSGALGAICALHGTDVSGDTYNQLTTKGIASKNEVVHDLFRTFDPNEQLHPHLGPNINAAKLLVLRGDASRGRQVFFGSGDAATGLCARCHRINARGADFGPDLSHVATKYNRADILGNVLNPSKTIAPGYATYVARTKSGDTFSGFLVRKTDAEVILKDPQLKEIRIPAADIERLAPQSISAMPEGLLNDLDSQQAADLLEFLASLK